jgi:hypothetical protein
LEIAQPARDFRSKIRYAFSMDESDPCRLAKDLIEQYGVDASVHAAQRAEASLRAGDLAGYAEWMRIGRAIDEMQSSKGPMKN